MKTEAKYTKVIASPVGPLRLIAEGDELVGVYFEKGRDVAPPAEPADAHPVLQRAARELNEYFAGRRKAFDLPLRATGTPFQQQVWRALAAIPFGERISYEELARRVGRPKAMRAVGAANGRNPLPIIVPCHRVVAKDGSLSGFGGGVVNKRRLLDHEQVVLGHAFALTAR